MLLEVHIHIDIECIWTLNVVVLYYYILALCYAYSSNFVCTRENTNAQLAPDSKRIHLEDQTTKPLSIDQDVQKDGISSRRIIKIKRKCKNESIFTQVWE